MENKNLFIKNYLFVVVSSGGGGATISFLLRSQSQRYADSYIMEGDEGYIRPTKNHPGSLHKTWNFPPNPPKK